MRTSKKPPASRAPSKRRAEAEALPSDPTTRYTLDVVESRIVAGELVIAACHRHLADLRNGHKRGLVWNPF
jgi:hypothetical protein